MDQLNLKISIKLWNSESVHSSQLLDHNLCLNLVDTEEALKLHILMYLLHRSALSFGVVD